GPARRGDRRLGGRRRSSVVDRRGPARPGGSAEPAAAAGTTVVALGGARRPRHRRRRGRLPLDHARTRGAAVRHGAGHPRQRCGRPDRDGTVNPVTVVEVGTYVSGPIVRWFCDYNTTVKVGQLCAQIDPRPFQMVADQAAANLAVAKAQLIKDQASLAYAKTTY